MARDKLIRTGQSLSGDAATAVAELQAQIGQEDIALVVFFCSSRFDLAALAAAINERFAGVPVIGCTTAGKSDRRATKRGG